MPTWTNSKNRTRSPNQREVSLLNFRLDQWNLGPTHLLSSGSNRPFRSGEPWDSWLSGETWETPLTLHAGTQIQQSLLLYMFILYLLFYTHIFPWSHSHMQTTQSSIHIQNINPLYSALISRVLTLNKWFVTNNVIIRTHLLCCRHT